LSDKVTVKDKNGNIFQVSNDDPRYKDGYLKFVTSGTIMVRYKDGRVGRIKQ